jgi:5'-phosphate synthase pdxT subunit
VNAAPASAAGPLTVGVLALQGDFEAHQRMLSSLGAATRRVRQPADLDGLAALVMPGGESTVMTLGIEREGLAAPLCSFAAQKPVLGTCAGLIMLDRDHLGILDLLAERNAFGRQLRSFEADLEMAGIAGGPVHAVFIRAPWVSEHGPTVEVLASVDGHPVAVRQGQITALAFHPELSGEPRFHRWLLDAAAR